MSSFLTNSVLDTDIYATNYGKVINAYMNPTCPITSKGETQVYNAQSGVCKTIPATAAVAPGATAAGCGGAPFKVKVDNTCYSTNNCPTSSTLSTTCLNTQHVPVRQTPVSGPGVIYNSVYAGSPNDYWRWT